MLVTTEELNALEFRDFAARVGWRDLVVVVLFLLFTLVFFLNHHRGVRPFVALGGDAANLAGFAAALDHPNLFAGDAVLGDPRHFEYYNTVHIPILRALFRLSGDYGTSFMLLLPFHVFAYCLGYYVLGRVLFVRRYWAFLFAVINLGRVDLNFWTWWGLHPYPIPRVSFQVLLPYLLTAALVWRSRPGRWPWLMVGAGLSMYVHPVGAPSWAFALWLSFLLTRDRGKSPRRHLVHVLLLGLVFLLVCSPFLASYVAGHAHGRSEDVDQEDVLAFMQGQFGKEFLDIPNGLRRFVSRWSHFERLLWLVAAAAPVLLTVRGGPREKGLVRTWVHWGCGVVFVSLVVPFGEQSVCRALGLLPLEIDLVRSTRFLVFFMLTFCFWSFAFMEHRWAGGWTGRVLLRAAGVVVTGVWLCAHPPMELDLDECWSRGEILCHPEDWDDKQEALDAIRREVPEGEAVLARDLEFEIRYYALRPVVYGWRDGPFLVYSDPAAALRWKRIRARMTSIDEIADRGERFRAIAELAGDLDARHVLLRHADRPDVLPPGAELLWENRASTLVTLRPPRNGPRTAPGEFR